MTYGHAVLADQGFFDRGNVISPGTYCGEQEAYALVGALQISRNRAPASAGAPRVWEALECAVSCHSVFHIPEVSAAVAGADLVVLGISGDIIQGVFRILNGVVHTLLRIV